MKSKLYGSAVNTTPMGEPIPIVTNDPRLFGSMPNSFTLRTDFGPEQAEVREIYASIDLQSVTVRGVYPETDYVDWTKVIGRDGKILFDGPTSEMVEPEPEKPAILPEIMLSNGTYYNFETADVSGVTIEVIAHALSHIGRFTGHTKRFYSVAEHCVRASYIGDPRKGFAKARLMHDCFEALGNDIATPMKVNMGGRYVEFEKKGEAALFNKFGVYMDLPDIAADVKHADRTMLATEKRDLLPKEGRQWKMLELVTPLKKRISTAWWAGTSWYWKRRFLARYKELS